jgi:hypothetical protein
MVMAHAFAFTPLLACARTHEREREREGEREREREREIERLSHLSSYISLLDPELGSASGAERRAA